MDREYQRVGMGVGAFHNLPRARYSEETKNLVKLLMDESKLTMLQRKTIQKAVDKGESLPASVNDVSTRNKAKGEDDGMKLPNAWRRRSYDTIMSSGVYQREQYRRTAPLPDKEKQKRHLACIMAYGQDMPETPHGPKIRHKTNPHGRDPQVAKNTVDPTDELVRAIRERLDFLRDMENLGLGEKYRPIMQQEIAQKIRLIESVDKQISDELRKEINEFS